MEDKTTPSGSANSDFDPVKDAIFEAAPDPLLDVNSKRDINLYGPGAIDRFGPRPHARERETTLAQMRQDEAARRGAAWQQHPSQYGRGHDARPTRGGQWGSSITHSDVMGAPRSRGIAFILALLFGYYGAHNFYLGLPNRAFANLGLWFLCMLTTLITGSIFMMLPIASVVIVEMFMIGFKAGPYQGR